MDFLHEYTKDGLHLPGFHWHPDHKTTCIINIHGILDHILENYIAEDLGKACIENGYGFLFGHNRGYGTINDITTKIVDKNGDIQTKRFGTTFDVFEDCVYDIQLWIDTAKKLGYKNIILMGHSMGCNKVIYYLSKHKVKELKGVILVSPPDFAGMEKVDPNYKNMLNEAQNNIASGHPEKLLSSLVWGFLHLSSGTFLSFYKNENLSETLPIIENPQVFKQLSSINVPILATLGSNDNIIIGSAKEHLQLLKSKATNCPDFSYKIINGANHRYMNKGIELANEIIDWAEKIKSK
ncbi:alpha/beta hydrolase [Clostridium botulinum]|uniref:alpha/beta hydrolase n=2 Tax=Clostridium botulinum TaxID=1491 RepID=UPI000957B515|nr:alpha/beta fold hydrolase [Clostridium botulinum]APU59543.1 cholesterol acyltransferase family protein [Clostridium botulinum]NFB30446.1 alpha/beta fold hydrolase [Clostridium botulinum]